MFQDICEGSRLHMYLKSEGTSHIAVSHHELLIHNFAREMSSSFLFLLQKNVSIFVYYKLNHQGRFSYFFRTTSLEWGYDFRISSKGNVFKDSFISSCIS